jgi:hypothetical protein
LTSNWLSLRPTRAMTDDRANADRPEAKAVEETRPGEVYQTGQHIDVRVSLLSSAVRVLIYANGYEPSPRIDDRLWN